MESIPQLAEDHTWTETARLPATCTAAGKIDYTCSVCSAEKSEPLAALEHNWVETARTPATCLVPGMICYSCSRCNETKTETIPQLGTSHIWTASDQTDATCVAPGQTGYTCSICGAVKTERIPALAGDMTMGSLLSAMSSVLSASIGWVGAVAQAVAAHPVLLLCVVLGFIGTGVLLFKRLLRL